MTKLDKSTEIQIPKRGQQNASKDHPFQPFHNVLFHQNGPAVFLQALLNL